MGRVILIMVAIYLILTVVRNIVRNSQNRKNINSKSKDRPVSNSDLKKASDRNKDDDNIIDAKFEEIK